MQQVLAPEPKKTEVAETKPQKTPDTPPVAAEARPQFECSDGTAAPSFRECQINMARTRLPPAEPAKDLPTGSVR